MTATRDQHPIPDHEESFVDRGDDRIVLRSYPDPVGAPDAPVVLVWPAMGVRASYYAPFAAALRTAGFAVVVADLRGTGDSTPAPSRASRYGYADLAGDVGAVLESLKPRLDGRTRILLGHSLGGQAALLHLALDPAAQVDGLALVAVGLPYWRAYPGRRRLGTLAGTQFIHGCTVALGRWPGWGFGGRQARGVIRDWAYTARTGRFPRLDGVDVEAAVREVRTPVLAVSVDHDQYTPHETLDYLCDKLVAAPIRRTRYTVAESGTRLDHFTWVRASAPIAARVAAFASELPPR
ncbi:alpha/beta fold hydrolase [Plantactinospora sp. KLBMP9567]|uniref:alpha/beta hydrolase family protein n=1 Tax=Plantactinospora sp. KLBMP9567 TaxID=3085900 RepID=UPI002982108B|nr:alpha/beta fold hydrolase [Plantactinospora sp. KLBMP9567]MDW5322969.1 alpha/beta fold hydrolase [Plantactinospora sp. KLBMP9567]